MQNARYRRPKPTAGHACRDVGVAAARRGLAAPEARTHIPHTAYTPRAKPLQAMEAALHLKANSNSTINLIILGAP